MTFTGSMPFFSASAVEPREPATGTSTASRSSCVMRPSGPVPRTCPRSTPSFCARARTAGDACAWLHSRTLASRATGLATACEGAAAGLAAPGMAAAGTLRGAEPCMALWTCSSDHVAPAGALIFGFGAGSAGGGAAFTSGFGGGGGGGAAAAGAASSPSPDVSNTTIWPPTGAMSPGSPWIEMILPSTGEVISTVALSVITSTSGASSLTTSPTLTCHATISASAVPSPTSGSLKTYWPMVLALRPPSRGAWL